MVPACLDKRIRMSVWKGGDVVHFIHNYQSPFLELLLFIAIPIAEVPTPNLLAVSAMDIPISRFRQYAILPLSSDILLPPRPQPRLPWHNLPLSQPRDLLKTITPPDAVEK